MYEPRAAELMLMSGQKWVIEIGDYFGKEAISVRYNCILRCEMYRVQ